MRTARVIALVVAVGLGLASARADELGTPIDLAGLAEMPAGHDSSADDLLLPVGLVRGDDGSTRRFYVAPIVGASWGQLLVQGLPTTNGNGFTAGGAVGMAITRPLGQVRIEAEGRYRDAIGGTAGSIDFAATGNWSSLANVWRDVAISDSLGIYGGGGIGAGGYQFIYGEDAINIQETGFAWQAGAGVIYAVSDRVTLDLGYRYYSVGPMSACDCGGLPGDIANQFVSNELLLTVRVYEPFRRWTR